MREPVLRRQWGVRPRATSKALKKLIRAPPTGATARNQIIDYYEASGVDLGHYVHEISLRPYAYAGHIVPYDAQAKELGTGKSRLEVLDSLGTRASPPNL
jgi:hypothetical protein